MPLTGSSMNSFKDLKAKFNAQKDEKKSEEQPKEFKSLFWESTIPSDW